jgi:hypothetical protein
MRWKDWPSWLKGGIVLDLIVIIIFLLYRFIWVPLFTDNLLILLLFAPGFLIIYKFIPPGCLDIMPGSLTPVCTVEWNVLITILVITNIIAYFIIGAIIGFIYGKIKFKNQPQLNKY